jgi:hypothetical protein
MTQTIDFRFEALFLLLIAATTVSLIAVIAMARGRALFAG